MNFFDSFILTFLNQFAHRWYALDSAMVFLAENSLVKGGFIAAVLWWIWFDLQDRSRHEEILISTLAASAVAVLAARALALALPFSTRPLYDPDLHFQQAFNVESIHLDGWSSFPSDHAALFFALATGIFVSYRGMGVLAFLHAFFIVSLPRVYLGIHYPTDVIVGAMMGSIITYLFTTPKARQVISWLPIQWMHKHPSSFYACFFLASWQLVTLFNGLLEVLRPFARVLLRRQIG
jgi:undecaprenyl-diphosphatase